MSVRGRKRTDQARRVAAYLHGTRDDEVAGRLAALRRMLAAETSLDEDTLHDLVDRARPRWGVKSTDDARAYVEFWDWLVDRFPVAALIGARSDVLYLLGGPARRDEVLVEFARAVKADPALFVKYAGDFSELAQTTDSEARLLYDLSRIRFYAFSVEQQSLDVDELHGAVRDLLERYPDRTDVQAELQAISMTTSRRVF